MGFANVNSYDVNLADFDKQIIIGEESFMTNSACHRILERAIKDPCVESVDIYVIAGDEDDCYLQKVNLRPSIIPFIIFDYTMVPIDIADNDFVYDNLVNFKDKTVCITTSNRNISVGGTD